MSNNNFINQFKRFASSEIKNHEPSVGSTLKKGTPYYALAYIESYSDQMKALNTTLVSEANRLLKQAEHLNDSDYENLREELFTLGKEAIQQFMVEYKPG